MSKKTNKRKKINIKLDSGQTFLIEDLQIFMHIQKTYASLVRGQISEEDKNTCNKVISAINTAVKNVYIATESDSSDENYWD